MKKILMSVVTFSLAFVFARDVAPTVKTDPVINSTQSSRPIVIDIESPTFPSTREEIILHEEDFEGDVSGWNTGNGWILSDQDYSSETYSMSSPDDNNTGDYKSNDLFSPLITLPQLGEGEIMHYKFDVFADMPDFSQEDDPATEEDESGFLADYWALSIMDVAALSWHTSNHNSTDGNSWWCGDEDVGGYLDSWVQYLDTPVFTVPAGGSFSADMRWGIESFAGVSGVDGECLNGGPIDGWDQANVQISVDGGLSFITLNGSDPYDFDCGYGTVYNNFLGLPGWGGSEDWHNVSFDLSAYDGQDAIIRFAFYSDPAYSTIDEASIDGFQVDNILVSSGAFSDSGDDDASMDVSGAVWVDQFYEYGDETQPGALGWTEYIAGYPFNGNAFMEISDFAGKDVIFRFQSRYDGDFSGGQGTGLWIDDLTIYKVSSGSYPAPQNLMAEAGDSEVMLSWDDMNASGTDDFIYDNNEFSNGISMVSEDSEGWAGTSFVFGAPSTVNTVSIYHDASNPNDYDMDICAFGTIGTLYAPDPIGCIDVNTVAFVAGWNQLNLADFGGVWEMSGSYIIGHTFNSAYAAFLDESVSWTDNHSFFNFTGTGGLGSWDSELSSDGSFEGEWGIRANITFESANVTYNVYRDEAMLVGGLSNNSYTDGSVENNLTYEYTVSATYEDGEESGPSNMGSATPQSNTVHEDSYDDGSSEDSFNAGSSNYLAVRFSANDAGEDFMRFKWYQTEDGGAFYLRVWEDNNGAPGTQLYSGIVASGLLTGWNEKDVSGQGIVVSGDYWVGVKEFSSSKPFGLDTDSDAGRSYYSEDDWATANPISANLMFHVFLDEGEGGGGACSASDFGDVNSDGSVNVLDIVTVVNFIMGNDEPTEYEACAGDINEDGSMNVLDIVTIVNIIMGN